MTEKTQPNTASPTVQVDFLHLDLTTCDRCIGTDASLDRAVGLLSPILREIGIQLDVRKKLVESEDQARQVGFVLSPTILVDGHDIADEPRESPCGPCGDTCGCGSEDTCINCRVWVHNGKEHTQAPVGLIVDAVLGAAYGRPRGQAAARGDKAQREILSAFSPASSVVRPPALVRQRPPAVKLKTEHRTEMTPDTTELWARLHERLLSFIEKRVRDRSDAEDILQEVFGGGSTPTSVTWSTGNASDPGSTRSPETRS